MVVGGREQTKLPTHNFRGEGKVPSSLILQGDARHIPLADESVQCVVTSPPYWGLRDYKLEPMVWSGREDCEHGWQISVRPGMTGGPSWRGSLGLEPMPELYVQHIVEIFREVKRVLRKD